MEGKFCHNCGQENLQMKESFGHMITHAVSDYFHFDDQFFSTLKPLLFKPGKLTVEYLAGHRASYLHPVKMYIFISLIFFLLFFKNSKHDADQVKHTSKSEQIRRDSAKKAVDNAVNASADLNAQQKKEVADNIKAFLPEAAAKEMSANIKKDSARVKARKEDDEGGFTIYADDTNEFKTYEAYLANQNKLPAGKRNSSLEQYMIKKNYDWKKQGKNAKDILIEGLKHNVPKMMFLLLPMFALILKLAFWNNRKLYVEHIIYTIHLHCFLFLFLTLTMLIKMIFPENWDAADDLIGSLATLTIIWYIYRSLRTVYNRSRWRTVSKMAGVSIMYTLVFTFSFIVILIITAVTSV